MCPACGQPVFKVYCTPIDDSSIKLALKQLGRSEYAGPCHRVDVPVE